MITLPDIQATAELTRLHVQAWQGEPLQGLLAFASALEQDEIAAQHKQKPAVELKPSDP